METKELRKSAVANIKDRLEFVGRPVNITIPASVAYNFDDMNTITKKVLGKLGCPGCHSGFDIRFIIENDYRFNERLDEIGTGF